MGLPWWLSSKEAACQCRRPRFDPWIGKILKEEMAMGGNFQYSCLEIP